MQPPQRLASCLSHASCLLGSLLAILCFFARLKRFLSSCMLDLLSVSIVLGVVVYICMVCSVVDWLFIWPAFFFCCQFLAYCQFIHSIRSRSRECPWHKCAIWLRLSMFQPWFLFSDEIQILRPSQCSVCEVAAAITWYMERDGRRKKEIFILVEWGAKTRFQVWCASWFHEAGFRYLACVFDGMDSINNGYFPDLWLPSGHENVRFYCKDLA